MTRLHSACDSRSELIDGLRKGLLIGSAFLLLALPPTRLQTPLPPKNSTATAGAVKPVRPPVRLADFRRATPSFEAREMADWVLTSGDHRKKAFVIVDKKDAQVYVFDARGRLNDVTPALLGSAVGDDTAPGVGDKPLAQVLPEEKTTPAGRFVAEVGMSTRGEDVVWVDYDAAVSMHRVLNVKERLAALATDTRADNRMSFGCINLPRRFYEEVLRPTVDAGGAVIYVLPETRSLQQTFTSFYEVAPTLRLAQH